MSHLTSRHLHSPTDTILDSPLAPLAMHRPDRPFHQYQQRRQASRQPDRILLISGLLGFFGIWFLTPLSVHVTDAVLLFVPVESDFEMGREAWRSMKHKYPPVSDLWGVEKIGKDLVTVLDQDGQRMSWSFAVVHAPMVNAFVLPGGIVRVTDTLLKSLHLSDAELAALIGHEMGHVLHRHSQARLLQQQLISYLWKAVFYEDNDDYQESFGEAMGELMVSGARFLGQQSFSRRDEYEADATAWELLMESRTYSPKAVRSLLQKLWEYQGGSGETSWESTHPGTKDRIGALEDKWDNLPASERRKLLRYPIS